jgi:hypothetical protein
MERTENQLNPQDPRRTITSGSGTEADAVIVSAFGRGNWLAQELCARGWRVTFVDVGAAIGAGDVEDAEGPFGYFDIEGVADSFKQRLNTEGETLQIPSGFSVWLKNGPIECSSELTEFQLKTHGISKQVESYLRRSPAMDKESERLRRTLSKQTFGETWFANFAHRICSTKTEENHRSLDQGYAAPFFAPFSIRQASANGALAGYKCVQDAGARAFYRSAVQDIRIGDRAVEAIEVSRETGVRSEIERGRTFIWMLSSAETNSFPVAVKDALFPAGVIEPEWFWMRYRIEMSNQGFDNEIPPYTVLIDDPFLPWTHANVVVLRKRREPRFYDAWIKLPLQKRAAIAELEVHAREIEALLASRAPSLKAKVVSLQPGSGTIDPVRVPIYSERRLAKLKTLKANNLFFCGPETWQTLDWLGQYREQNVILSRLEKLRAQWLAAEAREQARNAKQ